MRRGEPLHDSGRTYLVVWEDLIAVLPTRAHRRVFRVLCALRLYRAAARCWRVVPEVRTQLWDLWGDNVMVIVLTYLPPQMVPAIGRRLIAEDVPAVHVRATTPRDIARTLWRDATVARLLDSDPRRVLACGPKARVVPSGHTYRMRGHR